MVKATVVELLSRVHSRVSTTSVESKPGGVYISIMLVRSTGIQERSMGAVLGISIPPFLAMGKEGGTCRCLQGF